MPYVYDPINCIGMKVSTKDGDIWVVEYEDALGDTQKHQFASEAAARTYYDRTKKDSTYSKKMKIYRKGNQNDAKVKDEESYFESMRSKKYKIFGDIVLLKSLTGSTATYTTSNGQTVRIGRRKWDELARKINSKDKRTVDAYPQLRKINTPLGTSYRVDSASGSDWIQIDGHTDGQFDVTIWGEYKRPTMSPTVKKTGMSEQNAILLAKSYMSNANVHDNKVIDKAIKALDKTFIEEEDGVEIVYDEGTYILYVDGEPIADGSLNRMKQLMRQELNNR